MGLEKLETLECHMPCMVYVPGLTKCIGNLLHYLLVDMLTPTTTPALTLDSEKNSLFPPCHRLKNVKFSGLTTSKEVVHNLLVFLWQRSWVPSGILKGPMTGDERDTQACVMTMKGWKDEYSNSPRKLNFLDCGINMTWADLRALYVENERLFYGDEDLLSI